MDKNDNGQNNRTEYCMLCGRSEDTAGKMLHLPGVPGGFCICNDCMHRGMEALSNFDFQQLSGLDLNMLMNNPFLRFPGQPDGTGPDQNGPGSAQNGPGTAQDGPGSSQDGPGPAQDGSGPEQDGPWSDRESPGSEQRGPWNDDPDDGDTEQEDAGGPGAGHPVVTGLPNGRRGSSRPLTRGWGPSADGEGGPDGGDGKEGDGKEKSRDNGGQSTIRFLNLGDILNSFGGGSPRPQVKKKKKDGPKPVFSIDNIPAPHKIKEELDKYVVGQERAKKIISVAAYNHYKRVRTGTMDDIEIEKSNILMIGPTGCGKTYLVKTLARLLDVPLAITDATSLTEAGYIGDDIESVVSKLLAAADNDVERTEKGIIFIDEIDKIAKKENIRSRDVSGESVQQGLLKLLEGAEVEVPVGANSKNAMVPLTTIDTSNILFICGGAFPDLERIVRERLMKKTSIGFTAELKDKYESDKNILDYVTNEDLRRFGMIPEFIGRVPILCTLRGLDEEMLVRILKEPRNAILKQYQKLLALDEVRLEFEDDALRAIARKALEKDTGARALRSIIEEFMLDIMYEIPKDDNIGTVTITRAYIEGKGGPGIAIRGDRTEPLLITGPEESVQ